jgi:hypothetical protein
MTACEYGPIAAGALSVFTCSTLILTQVFGVTAQCYSTSIRSRQLEQRTRVVGDGPCHVFIRDATRDGEPRDGVTDPSRLVPLSAIRHRRKIGRIRFSEDAIVRHELQQLIVSPLLERNDSAE